MRENCHTFAAKQERKHMKRFEKDDKVILNPNVEVGKTYGGLVLFSHLMFTGIETIDEVSVCGIKIGACYYPPEILLPVPVFKEGDVVTVRPDLSIDCCHYNLDIRGEMLYLRGKQVRIKGVTENSYTLEKIGEDGCEYYVEGSPYTWSSNSFIINNLTQSKDENRLQEKEPVVTGGSEFKGCRVCGRKNKAAITVGHLSYKRIS